MWNAEIVLRTMDVMFYQKNNVCNETKMNCLDNI